MSRFDNCIGVKVPEILLPKKGSDMSKWACVACDQFTSQPEYWEAVENYVGGDPSTLRLMLPEMYLEKPDEAQRIDNINATMHRYLEDGTLVSQGEGFLLVRRSVAGRTRTGIMMALDLEKYDYSKGSTTLIRATEGTIVERIPPRLRIRRDAVLELPHIMVLIDDPDRTVVEPLAEAVCKKTAVYDFDLMQNGGHITGWNVTDEGMIRSVIDALEKLADPEAYKAKYGCDQAPLLFAMGDGNHSFATAKANWENLKATLPESERADHPARYCLIELENVHDTGIIFEPIHRVVFNIDTAKAIEWLKNRLASDNGGCDAELFPTREECDRAAAKNSENCFILPFVVKEGFGFFRVKEPAVQLEVGALQNALDVFIKETPGSVIDYVHGADVVIGLSRKDNNMGFLLPPMAKSAFFRTVIFDGALPRKTFSMGEANEKRYYLECRKIGK